MNYQRKMTLGLLVAGLIVSVGCSVSASSGKKKKKNNQPPAVTKLSATLHGDWQSECMVYPIGHNTYHMINLSFDNEGMKYVENIFRDASCTQVNAEDTKILEGDYKVFKTFSEGIQAVEMMIPIGENAYTRREFNVVSREGFLLISQFYQSAFDEPETVPVRYRLAKLVDENEERDKDEDGSPEPTPIYQLQEGMYEAVSGDTTLCPHEVKVEEDFRTQQISYWVSEQPPCWLHTRPYACDEFGACDSQSEGRTLRATSATSYIWVDTVNGQSAEFQKR